MPQPAILFVERRQGLHLGHLHLCLGGISEEIRKRWKIPSFRKKQKAEIFQLPQSIRDPSKNVKKTRSKSVKISPDRQSQERFEAATICSGFRLFMLPHPPAAQLLPGLL